MNNAFVADAAVDLAERSRRLSEISDQSSDQPVHTLFRLAVGRDPTDWELDTARAFLAESDADDPLASFAHVLFTLNEFIYVE